MAKEIWHRQKNEERLAQRRKAQEDAIREKLREYFEGTEDVEPELIMIARQRFREMYEEF